MNCVECGVKLTDEDEFCPECGHKVVKKTKTHRKDKEEKSAGKSFNWLYIVLGIVVLIAIIAVIFFVLNKTADNQLTCQRPYILVGGDCCLDQNNNGICDKDETQSAVSSSTSQAGVSPKTDSTTVQTRSTSSLATFIGGTNSISLDFDASTFPAEVFDNKHTPFTIAIKLENKGEYLVPKEKIRVSLDGFDPAEFGKTNADMKKSPLEDLSAIRLDATTGNLIPGAQTAVEFGEFSYISKVLGQTERPTIATICFDYATTAQASLCINEKPFETINTNTVCDVKGTKTVAVSSGPVQITNLQETPTGASKMQFTFDVEHQGEGSVYKQSLDCSAGNENKVFITIDTGDMTSDLFCTGIGTDNGAISGYITLYDGKKSIACTQSIGTKTGTFEKQVTIKLQYGYKKTKSAQLVIKPSSAVSGTTSEQKLRIISVSGVPQICSLKQTDFNTLKFTIENGLPYNVDELKLTMIGDLSTSESTIGDIDLAKLTSKRFGAYYTENQIGNIKQVRITPVAQGAVMNDDALVVGNIYACTS